MSDSTPLLALLAAVFIGLVAIWRELRVLSRGVRVRRQVSREVLPLSSVVSVLPGKACQITARPDISFKPERVFISAAGTSGGAADWVINDIKIGGRSVFLESGDVPGDMFASTAIDSFLSFPVTEAGQSVVIVATYVGLRPEGAPLYASMVGMRALKKKSRVKQREKELVAEAN